MRSPPSSHLSRICVLTTAHEAIIFVGERAHHGRHVFFHLLFLLDLGRCLGRGGGRRRRRGRGACALLQLLLVHCELNGVGRRLRAQVIHTRLQTLQCHNSRINPLLHTTPKSHGIRRRCEETAKETVRTASLTEIDEGAVRIFSPDQPILFCVRKRALKGKVLC